MWEISENFIKDMSKRLDVCRQAYVLKHETKIIFGAKNNGKNWYDVEADEVDLGKELQSNNKVAWQQWAGIVERGRPASLVLFRTKVSHLGVQSSRHHHSEAFN